MASRDDLRRVKHKRRLRNIFALAAWGSAGMATLGIAGMMYMSNLQNPDTPQQPPQHDIETAETYAAPDLPDTTPDIVAPPPATQLAETGQVPESPAPEIIPPAPDTVVAAPEPETPAPEITTPEITAPETTAPETTVVADTPVAIPPLPRPRPPHLGTQADTVLTDAAGPSVADIPLPIPRPASFDTDLAQALENAPDIREYFTERDMAEMAKDPSKFTRPANTPAPTVVRLSGTGYGEGDIIVNYADIKAYLVLPDSECTVPLNAGDHCAIEYTVAIGRDGAGIIPNQGDLGTHMRLFMEADASHHQWPQYNSGSGTPTAGGVNNPLGIRFAWLVREGETASRGEGIHGTARPDLLGGEVSNGCFRMFNDDVMDMFQRLPDLHLAMLQGMSPSVYVIEDSGFQAQHIQRLNPVHSVLPAYPTETERLARIGLESDPRETTALASADQAPRAATLPVTPRP